MKRSEAVKQMIAFDRHKLALIFAYYIGKPVFSLKDSGGKTNYWELQGVFPWARRFSSPSGGDFLYELMLIDPDDRVKIKTKPAYLEEVNLILRDISQITQEEIDAHNWDTKPNGDTSNLSLKDALYLISIGISINLYGIDPIKDGIAVRREDIKTNEEFIVDLKEKRGFYNPPIDLPGLELDAEDINELDLDIEL
jgi:hypothetical protein